MGYLDHFSYFSIKTYGLVHGLQLKKTRLLGLQTTKAQIILRSVNRAFVNHVMESVVAKRATSEIALF